MIDPINLVMKRSLFRSSTKKGIVTTIPFLLIFLDKLLGAPHGLVIGIKSRSSLLDQVSRLGEQTSNKGIC
jgi:hypothetical protein